MQRILFLLGLSLFNVSFFIGDILAQDVQLVSPNTTFTAKEVFFRNPVTYLGLDGKPRALSQRRAVGQLGVCGHLRPSVGAEGR